MKSFRKRDDDIAAVFGYGTLRGDYTASGDKWGVARRTSAVWKKAFVSGFRLYQDPAMTYPFIVPTGVSTDIVYGTLFTWPGRSDDTRRGVAMMDRIEGINRDPPLYRRRVVGVSLVDREGVALLETNSTQVDAQRPGWETGSSYRSLRPKGAQTQPDADASDREVVQAYIYYQNPAPSVLQDMKEFPSGDWLSAVAAKTLY